MTMEEFEGRVLVEGSAEGTVLVCDQAISGWGGIDPVRGVIVEVGHPQHGESVAGRVLIIPGAKGSSGWSGQFHLAKLLGKAPVAIITRAVNSKLALGLVVLGIPAVTDLPEEFESHVKTGDNVRVSDGRITVSKMEVKR